MSKPEPDADQEEKPRFPERDEDGRIVSLTEFLAFVLMALAVAVVMLGAVDVLFALLSFGTFGQISGFICGVLAVFIFFEEFRAWRDRPVRWLVMPLAVLLALAAGLGVLANLPEWWKPLFTGSLAATLSALVYAVLWFTGMRLIGSDRP